MKRLFILLAFLAIVAFPQDSGATVVAGELKVNTQERLAIEDRVIVRGGGGKSLDATNAGASKSHEAALEITGDICISFWLYPLGTPEFQNVFHKGTNFTNGTPYYIRLRNTTTAQWLQGEAGNSIGKITDDSFPVNTWTHYAASRDATGATLDQWVNNSAQTQLSFNVNTLGGNNETLTIQAGNSQGFYIDEIRVYDAQCSAGDIANLYNNTSIPTANLQGEWLFTGGTGADTSGNGFNLSVSGTIINKSPFGGGTITIYPSF